MDRGKYLHAAVKLQTQGRLGEAEKIYVGILEDEPDNHDALQLLGLIMTSRGKNIEALKLIEKAISLKPNVASFHHNIAGIYRQMGRMDDAEKNFRLAIKLKPDYGEAYQGLSEMIKFGPEDSLLNQIEEQLEEKSIPKPQRSYLHFAAGKVLDDIGNYSSAFKHYEKANYYAERQFDLAAFRQELKNSLYVFSKERLENMSGVGHPSKQPIFIVGMPRSGSTLIEQILAGHSKVYAAGELNDIKSIAAEAVKVSTVNTAYPNYLPHLEGKRYAEFAAAYLKRIASLTDGEYDRIVDKHPLNFRYIALIFLMFPNAKIIHTQRNPLDTCLSCFFQNFTRGQNYTFDLANLAGFFQDYRRFMSHWQTLFGARIYHVSYEKLLANQAGETQKLLSYCGLEFEDSCLQFHEVKRDVKTASFMQVRQPIYRSSLGRWENYREELRDLASAIGESI